MFLVAEKCCLGPRCISVSRFLEVSMPRSRRHMLSSLFGAAGVLAVEPLLVGLQAPASGSGGSPKAKVYPNGRDPNIDTGIDDPSRLDPKAVARANQIEIRTDIAKLYELVSELRTQIEKTDATATLSISVVKKAQQIEKLAKHIKDLAKG
jgi:hypothetical protein